MHESALVYVIAVFVLTACLLHTPLTESAAASEIDLAHSSPERTRMMQQSDHQRRVKEEREARAENQAVVEVEAVVESQSAGIDYVVLGVLIASAVILILISTRKRIVRLRP